MGIVFRTTVTISNSFRNIIKRQQYEKLVLAVLNRSTLLIPNLPLTYVEEQFDGQCDFLDTEGAKYDVKLLLDSKQGALIGEPKNDLSKWFHSMMDEATEFSECISQRKQFSVVNTRFYKLAEHFVKRFKFDEIGILFVPYPVVHDYKESFFLRSTTDFIRAVVAQLIQNNTITCKRLLFLYPSIESGVLVLREADVREYIAAPEITEYIDYETIPSVE